MRAHLAKQHLVLCQLARLKHIPQNPLFWFVYQEDAGEILCESCRMGGSSSCFEVYRHLQPSHSVKHEPKH